LRLQPRAYGRFPIIDFAADPGYRRAFFLHTPNAESNHRQVERVGTLGFGEIFVA
jgi:hypothetical protein